MPTDTWQSGVATICCMAIVCMIFMWDPYTVHGCYPTTASDCRV
ncbi:hypothetical protein COOONC_21730 [Cooperia oncophora]